MDTLTSTPASTNFDRLKTKLRELFELDKADLDFGIYRILRQRHSEITEFLDRHLETTVRGALASHGDTQLSSVKEDLKAAEDGARALGMPPEAVPRVQELRAKLGAGVNPDEAANEVYSHLFKFFSRYYEEGDLLGLHRSTVAGKERYMIPYNGEEVKLVWANMDQYYIKSSELLRDYTFRLRPAADSLFVAEGPEEVVVHFKLVEGDTEKDNRKADSKTERRFALDEETPFVEDGPASLTIRFRYKEFPAQRNLQDNLNRESLAALEKSLPEAWKARLFVVETRYCLTLDRVPEALYPEIVANEAQWEEWASLGLVKINGTSLFDSSKNLRSVEFLKENKYLIVEPFSRIGSPTVRWAG
ncbi:hypothetical protein [Armatimonas sp.]|uniref:hypothetical protein n=1 Tax=Armatimonas sp. TaxID=1872638 RepID=UPI003751CD7A